MAEVALGMVVSAVVSLGVLMVAMLEAWGWGDGRGMAQGFTPASQAGPTSVLCCLRACPGWLPGGCHRRAPRRLLCH